jgi:prevent-host-death family protein
MMDWKLAEAKNKFSEVFDKALNGEPQRITRRGKAVVVINDEEYKVLTGEKMNFIEFLMQGPDLSELDLTRDQSPPRDIEL